MLSKKRIAQIRVKAQAEQDATPTQDELVAACTEVADYFLGDEEEYYLGNRTKENREPHSILEALRVLARFGRIIYSQDDFELGIRDEQ
jgi:hypothetical protein